MSRQHVVAVLVSAILSASAAAAAQEPPKTIPRDPCDTNQDAKGSAAAQPSPTERIDVNTGPLKEENPPLWSFAWLSDMHLDQSRLAYTARLLHYVDAGLQPHFVLLTGDNNSYAAPPTDPSHPETLGVRQQRFLKAFLEEHLKRPYVLVTADNWTEGFDTVFGPHQSSFDCGGLHFLLVDPDRVHHGAGAEGLSVFEERTWAWMRRDLDRNRDKPTIVALHEPMHPPTFLDAPRLRELVDQHPNVFAVLQGHLHVDLELRRHGTTYLVAPSLGRTPSPAMKLVHVYPEGLIIRTIVDSQTQGDFRITSRRQQILIPPTLRGRLHRPPGASLVKANYDCLPATPIVDDPALAARAGEVFENAVQMLWSAVRPPRDAAEPPRLREP